MKSIIENYNLLVNKFREMEKDSTPNEIHDKRVIIRRIFPILSAFDINPSKVKYGEEAFKLFGQLRDIQVQIEKIESLGQNVQLIDYLEYLKEKEVKLKEKVSKFSKKKKLKFPKIKKNKKVDTKKIIKKAKRQLYRLSKKTSSLINSDGIEIHAIRIDFKKYRYLVEVLKYIENIDEDKLNDMKHYQDILGDIHDYDVLMNGIKTYYKKEKLNNQVKIDVIEKEQYTLIEKFKSEADQFMRLCEELIFTNNKNHNFKVEETNPETELEVILTEPNINENEEVQEEVVVSSPISPKKKKNL